MIQSAQAGHNRIDFLIIGSGFGGSVSALRLAEKGYSVLILEKGKRWSDHDHPTTNLQFWKYIWAPFLRSFGILQISVLKDLMVLHGVGVGGGSLGYANVLEIPSDDTFASNAWNKPINWGKVLSPFYPIAQQMLGAAITPRLWKADQILKEIAQSLGTESTFRPTMTGIYFGEPGEISTDPYFSGDGPTRTGCTFCGACMVGCRQGAKNTLSKNYLHFAERFGAKIEPEMRVLKVQPWVEGGYKITAHSSTSPFKPQKTYFAKNVIFAGGVMGTVPLLLNLREDSTALPKLSARLGENVRTNSEALLGSLARTTEIDFSEGVAISSIMNINPETRVEPVRYPKGSGLMRMISAPLISLDSGFWMRLHRSIKWILSHPIDATRAFLLPRWAQKVTILLVMQNVDNRMKFTLAKNFPFFWKKRLVTENNSSHRINPQVPGSHLLTRSFSDRTNGIPLGSLGENLLNLPTTAHILGGVPIGNLDETGVVDDQLRVHHYPGLYVIDGSVMPGNPGVNPSLTITAIAEYAMSFIPAKGNNQ